MSGSKVEGGDGPVIQPIMGILVSWMTTKPRWKDFFFLMNTFPNKMGRGRLAKGEEERRTPDITHFPCALRGAGAGSPATSLGPGWPWGSSAAPPASHVAGLLHALGTCFWAQPPTDALHLGCYCRRGFQSLLLAWKFWGIHAKRQNKLNSAAVN